VKRGPVRVPGLLAEEGVHGTPRPVVPPQNVRHLPGPVLDEGPDLCVGAQEENGCCHDALELVVVLSPFSGRWNGAVWCPLLVVAGIELRGSTRSRIERSPGVAAHL
jgi:hypothetical protein